MTKIDLLKICGIPLAMLGVLIFAHVGLNSLNSNPTVQQTTKLNRVINSIRTGSINITPKQMADLLEKGAAVDKAAQEQMVSQRAFVENLLDLLLFLVIVHVAVCIYVFRKYAKE